MPILRKLTPPELLPVLARAQWSLAAEIMRKANGGDLISRAALPHFRNLAKHTEDLVELVGMTGNGEIYTVSFYDSTSQTFTDRQLIDWAVDEYVNATENGSTDEWHLALTLKAHWEETSWQEWGK